MRNDFTQAYIECALWITGDDEAGYEYLGDHFDPEDIHPDSLGAMLADCADFQQANAADLEAAYETPEYTPSNAGHDFWLTRNGHGAGFWDRDLGTVGDRLSEACKPYGTRELYLGDDGNIHTS
jgi:hypothetical protein